MDDFIGTFAPLFADRAEAEADMQQSRAQLMLIHTDPVAFEDELDRLLFAHERFLTSLAQIELARDEMVKNQIRIFKGYEKA